MEIFIILIVVLLVMFFILRAKKEKKTKESYDKNVAITNTYAKSNNYQIEENIFNTSYPFFYALSKHADFVDSLKPEYESLIENLTKIKNEDIFQSITQLLFYNKWRETKGLPKYLQSVPIHKFIENGIFVKPTSEDLEEIFNSMTFKELKDLCSKNEIKPQKSKKETIFKLVKEEVPVEFEKYFKLNPLVNKIYHNYEEYCYNLIDKKNENTPITIEKLKEQIDIKHLDISDSIKAGEYSVIQEDFSTEIKFCKKNTALFIIEDYNIGDIQSKYGFPLENGLLFLVDNIRIGDFISTEITILDENATIQKSSTIRGGCFNISPIQEKSIVYGRIGLGGYWILNYETLKEKTIENRENVDIYSLLE